MVTTGNWSKASLPSQVKPKYGVTAVTCTNIMLNKTKDDLLKELEETKRQLAEVQERAEATGAATNPAEAMMKEFLAMMKMQQKKADAQRRAQREAEEAERMHLLDKIDKLVGELVDTEKRAADTNSREPKPITPPRLEPETSVPKSKAWRNDWGDNAYKCKVEMSLDEQHRSSLTVEMQGAQDERIGEDPEKGPNSLLDDIKKYKKRNMSDNMIENEDESIDSYLPAVQQLAQDSPLTKGDCPDYRIKCLDHRLAECWISGINKEARMELLREQTFLNKDKVVAVSRTWESAFTVNYRAKKPPDPQRMPPTQGRRESEGVLRT